MELPNAINLEESVLGALLLEPYRLPYVSAYLRPECFYSTKNSEVYNAILRLDGARKVIDILTVTEELNNSKKLTSIGGAYYVSTLTNRIASGENIEAHALIIYEKFILREILRLSNLYSKKVTEPSIDVPELLESFVKSLTEINYVSKSKVKNIGEAVNEILTEQKNILDNGRPNGYLSGLNNLDRYFTKQKQDLGIIAARPGMGKTAFMLNLAVNSAKKGNPVAIFSLEMSTAKLVGRAMAAEAQISSKEINEKTLDSGKLLALGGSCQKLIDLPIYFDDTPDVSIIQLRSSIRKMVSLYAIKEVYIDYLQLMKGEQKGNREQEISYITRNLKKIAKEENIPITALSQLSREVEKRPDKRPQLSDLRESGAIEQDADWVFFLWRPEYYGLTEIEDTFNGQRVDVSNLMVLDNAKYREGSLFKSAFTFYGEFMLVRDYRTGLTNNNNFFN